MSHESATPPENGLIGHAESTVRYQDQSDATFHHPIDVTAAIEPPRQPNPGDQPTTPPATRPDTQTPQLRVCNLGSGSGGNSTLVTFGRDAILLDAGFGPMTTRQRLQSTGIDLQDVRAICVSHFDRDHFRPTWISTMVRQRIRLVVHRWHADDVPRIPGGARLIEARLVEVIERDDHPILDGVVASCVRLPHDHKGTTGFHLATPAGDIGFATDLGCVPPQLIERFDGVDLLAIESNYDPEMQRGSHRPMMLKRRIMGKQGHLSNRQAFDAVRAIVDRSGSRRPQRIMLLHRSRQCNCPHIIQSLFNEDPRIGPFIVQTDQRRRTPWITVRPGAARPTQLGLFT